MADKTRLFSKLSGNTRLCLMIIALSCQFMTASTTATKSSPSSKPGLRQSIPELYSTPGLRQSKSGSLSDAGFRPSLDFAQSQTGQNPPAQDQPIRVKTELINLRAVVTDKKGQPITNLRKEDFELMENGAKQEVSFFSAVKIPGRDEARRSENIPANAAPGAPPGVTSAGETPGRTVVLYIDTLHLSAPSQLWVKQ